MGDTVGFDGEVRRPPPSMPRGFAAPVLLSVVYCLAPFGILMAVSRLT